MTALLLNFSTRRRRWILVLALVAVLGTAGYAQRTAVLTLAGGAMIRSDVPRKADAIVVLSGGSPERELAAADLYLAGWAPRVLLAEGPTKPSLAELKRRGVRAEYYFETQVRYLRELRVPEAALVPLQTRVETTADEALLVAQWCRDHHAKSIIVVTSSFHTKRAGYIFNWALDGQNVEVLVHAAPLDAFKPDSWWKSGWTLRMGIIEMQKTLYYRLRYW